MTSFNLELRGYVSNKETFEFHLDADYINSIEQTEVRGGSVDVTLTMTRKSEDLFALDMVCEGQLTVGCDRCLDDMTLPVNTQYQVTVKMQGEEFDDSTDGVLVVPEGLTRLDVGPLMRDTVLLSIPLVHSHPEGQCNPQMSQLLESMIVDSDESREPEQEPATDPRWDALRELKD